MISSGTNINPQLQEEASFADAEYAAAYTGPEINPNMFRKYLSPTHMWDWRQRAARLLGSVDGKQLLDYGCGQGEESIYFAKLGARVTAIDISTHGIQITRERAAHNGLADRVNARVMNAIPTEFPPETFDLVHGMGILHHVGLRQGLEEVGRVLKPGGGAVFLEPLGSSRVVEACKRALHRSLGRRLDLTPVTSGEENLRLRDIRRACRSFATSEVYTYHLTHRARKLFIPRRLHNAMIVFDYHLLRMLPPLEHFAGGAVIYLRK